MRKKGKEKKKTKDRKKKRPKTKGGHWTQEIDGKKKGKERQKQVRYWLEGWEVEIWYGARLFQFSRSEFSLCDPMDCNTPGCPVHHQLLELAQTHVILCHPLLLLPSVFPSISVFSKESVLCIRWPKYWSFSFIISPSNELSGLVSFRMDWFDLLAVQGTLKSLLQHYGSKASILQHSAFFIVQLSYPCMTTGKTIALTRWTFVSKVTSLLFNMLSKLVIAFLPRSKHLFFLSIFFIEG